MPLAVVDPRGQAGRDAGDAGAQGEGELETALEDLQGDEIVLLVVAAVVEEQRVQVTSGEPGEKRRRTI